jgi:hypothetical protein
MITLEEIHFDRFANETNHAPLAFIIGEDVLYTYPFNERGTNLCLNFTDAIDVSNDFPENEGLTIKFMKNETELETLNTSEYFGSILLSNPKVINLVNHKRGYATGEPAKFIDNEFYVLDGRSNDSLSDWTSYNMKEDGYQCEGTLCGCKK